MENLIRIAIIAAAFACAAPQPILGQVPDIEAMKRSLEAQIGLYQRVNDLESRVTNLEQKGGDPASASETVAPSPGSAAAPPKDAVADLSICPCLGYKGKAHCYCLQRGVQCRCNRTTGSEWNMDGGRPVNKTGRYADPRRSTQPIARREETAASDNSVPSLKSDGFYWWQGPNGRWYNWSTMPVEGGRAPQQDGTKFVMRGGKMVPEMAVQIQQPTGRWVRRCYGGYCRMEWVPQ